MLYTFKAEFVEIGDFVETKYCVYYKGDLINVFLDRKSAVDFVNWKNKLVM